MVFLLDQALGLGEIFFGREGVLVGGDVLADVEGDDVGAPGQANVSAWLRPWPRAAPVISATLPSSFPIERLLRMLVRVRRTVVGGEPNT